MNLPRCKLILCCLFLGVCQSAWAIPITWNLLDVSFDDGSTANGSFVFDADIGSYSSIAISTFHPGGGGSLFGDPIPTSPGNARVIVALQDDSVADFTGQATLLLEFAAPLTNAGGSVNILQSLFAGGTGSSYEGICSNATCQNSIGPFREVLQGMVTTDSLAVPVPATLSLIGLGLAGLGWSRRKQM